MLIGLLRQDYVPSATIGACGIKTYRAFGAPSHFQKLNPEILAKLPYLILN